MDKWVSGYDLEGDGERYSFDSDGFDEESMCSWLSEPESLCNVWRGWTWKSQSKHLAHSSKHGVISSLIELSAKAVASHIPFALVESYHQPIPEDLQLKIAFWSFPDNEEDIRLYSCLANGSADEFLNGDKLYKAGCVKQALQIGFHLSGQVISQPNQLPAKEVYRTSVVFDRQRITANNCTCEETSWCQHIVALCLHRINQAKQVELRAPISESLGRLDKSQLRKFAQYLIHELQDQQILPTAQRLLDELLSSIPSKINTLDGAPDPTAGPEGDAHASWHMDQRILHENVKKTLVKFCVPSPVVYSDLNCLSSSAPPAAAEWQNLLRPLRGREPEGIWNLLSIVRELLRRQDSNAAPLLEILTDEMLQCEQLLVWWFNTKISSAQNGLSLSKNGNNNVHSSQNAASSLCDEIVTLWRLVALNPTLSPLQREDLRSQLETWHIMTLDKVRTAKCSNAIKKEDIEIFPGFKPAYEVTLLDWKDYRIDGVTYNEACSLYLGHFTVPGQTCLTNDSCSTNSKISPVINYQVDNSKYSFAADEMGYRLHPPAAADSPSDQLYDSSASEGFCDQDPQAGAKGGRSAEFAGEQDTDSSDEGIKVQKDGYNVADDDSDFDNQPPQQPISVQPTTTSSYRSAACGDLLAAKLEEFCLHNASALNFIHTDTQSDEPNYFAGIKKLDDEKEILFARAEALHAHGYVLQACQLASRLALDMLRFSGDSVCPGSDQLQATATSCRAPSPFVNYNNTPLAKTAFLCTVLSEVSEFHHLAFKIGMYGLEMPREPASSKALEVKFANQENELVSLLKKIPLGQSELGVIREQAEQLRDGLLKSRGEAHLPMMLATFIFETLSFNGSGSLNASGASSHSPGRCSQPRLPSDEQLGFDAAVAALGLKTNVSEAQHPLICEGIRRQKGDLAVSLMIQYKDDQYKLDKILEKLLDKEIHQLFKAPPISTYLTPSTGSGAIRPNPTSVLSRATAYDASEVGASSATHSPAPDVTPRGSGHTARQKSTKHTRISVSPDEAELDDVVQKDIEAKIRCAIYGKLKRPSVGMAAVDSSAPETTSSDNSPTVARRTFGKIPTNTQGGAGSDSESSGKSSDSVGSGGSSHPRPARPKNTESPSTRYQYTLEPRSTKVSFRNKGKLKATPTEPNQPSEALAHFMFELAKTLLQKAGGSSSTSLFTQRDHANHSGPHRLLHLCAFQVGLYALGINNCVSKNWLSRTYSSHVSWITGQALEIGSVAIHILIDTWEGHLTPTEVASLTDKASRGRDPNMVRAAAELALSCLAHAQALNPQETRRALLQCKEQSSYMLEKACNAVEGAAKDGSVSPDVLFDVARKWYELYEESRLNHTETDQRADAQNPALTNMPQQAPVFIANGMVRQGSPHHIQNSSNLEGTISSQTVVPVAAYCRGFQPVIAQMNPNPAFQLPFAYMSCYPPAVGPATQYTPSVQQVPAGYISAPVQFGYNQAFAVPSVPGMVQSPVGMVQSAAANMYHMQTGTMFPPQNMSPVNSAPGNIPAAMIQISQQPIMHNIPPHHLVQNHQQQFPLAQNTEQYNFVMSAFRVGMLALETDGRRINDERPQTKYNKNPSFREDIKWLLNLSIKLGPNYLQQFCQNVVVSVFSPFILFDIAMEVAHFHNRTNQCGQLQIFRSPVSVPLMQRCLQMFHQSCHHRIHHIQPADYDEFVSIVTAARKAFGMVPNGLNQFQEMLQGLKRNKSCKKELWQRIMSGLATVQ